MANKHLKVLLFCAVLVAPVVAYFWFFRFTPLDSKSFGFQAGDEGNISSEPGKSSIIQGKNLMGFTPVVISQLPVGQTAHLYGNKNVSIEKIKLKVFYVVPKDRTGQIYKDWRSVIEKAMAKITDFHKLQFRGYSEINYEIHSKPVILENNGSFYDENNTGNAKALKLIAEELEKRVLEKADKQSNYPVLGIIYEGFGAVGGVIEESNLESEREFAKLKDLPESVVFKVAVESADGFFLVSRSYLFEEEYKFSGLSFLYHEFAHTFGVQDYYDQKTGLAFSNDIMGVGLQRPFESNFISSVILKDLGVIN